MTLLKLIETKKTETNVMALSLTNNNDRLLHFEDLSDQSKFIRQSKKRLDVDFVQIESDDKLVEVWKSIRHDSGDDWFLYIYNGSYKAFSEYKRKRSRKYKKTAKIQSLLEGTPDKDKVLHVIFMDKGLAMLKMPDYEQGINCTRTSYSAIDTKFNFAVDILAYLCKEEIPVPEFNEIRFENCGKGFVNLVNYRYPGYTEAQEKGVALINKAVKYYGSKGIGVLLYT